MKSKECSIIDNDLGDKENIHKLSPKEWKNTDVVRIDIVNDNITTQYQIIFCQPM